MTLPDNLRLSSLADEIPMQASKWLQSQILIDAEEMESLFAAMGDFSIFQAGSLTKAGYGAIDKKAFLDLYSQYIEILKSGSLPEESWYRPFFSSVFSSASDALYAVLVEDGQQLLRVSKPVIQLQPHRLGYSEVDGKFRPMVFGTDNIVWGIQFSYPQLFMDQPTHQVVTVDLSDRFPNTQLFRKLQKWVRHNTVPTPFIVKETQINIPMRLGKECFSWINRHPQLIEKGLKIKEYREN